jgi:hypothetical protein
VVGTAVILAEERAARAALSGIFADTQRVRPFHWHEEGPAAREAMIAVLGEIGAVAHVCVHYPTGRNRLEAARASALGEVVPLVPQDGASTLLIESRGAVEDGRDRAVILDILNALARSGELQYEWRTKGRAARMARGLHLRHGASASAPNRRSALPGAACRRSDR